MRPENDIKNPYLWLLMLISVIPAIPAHFIFDYYFNDFLMKIDYFVAIIVSIIFVTLPM